MNRLSFAHMISSRIISSVLDFLNFSLLKRTVVLGYCSTCLTCILHVQAFLSLFWVFPCSFVYVGFFEWCLFFKTNSTGTLMISSKFRRRVVRMGEASDRQKSKHATEAIRVCWFGWVPKLNSTLFWNLVLEGEFSCFHGACIF